MPSRPRVISLLFLVLRADNADTRLRRHQALSPRQNQCPGDTKANEVATNGFEVLEAASRAEELGIVVPDPAAQNTFKALATGPRGAVGRCSLIGVAVTILRPRPDTTHHTVKADQARIPVQTQTTRGARLLSSVLRAASVPDTYLAKSIRRIRSAQFCIRHRPASNRPVEASLQKAISRENQRLQGAFPHQAKWRQELASHHHARRPFRRRPQISGARRWPPVSPDPRRGPLSRVAFAL